MSREDAVEWVREHGDGLSWRECAEATGWKRSTLQNACRDGGVEKLSSPKTAAPVAGGGGSARMASFGNDALSLPPDDRIELVNVVRESRRVISRIVRRVDVHLDDVETFERDLVDADDEQRRDMLRYRPELDKGLTMAARNLSGMVRDLVTTHPGLMSEVKRTEQDADADATERRLTRTYGAGGDEPPTG